MHRDRVFRPGNYTVSFSRGHGQVLETITTVARYSMVRKFPSPWVDKHEVSLEACVEGTQEVIPHTEQFLMAYKEWNWVANHRWFSHPASKACLTFENKTKSVNLQTCEAANLEQKWIRRGGTIHPLVDRLLCLKPMARNSHQVRRPVFVSKDCATKWNLTDGGLLRSFVPEKEAPPEQHGLCLAARLEGRFNYKY